MPRSPKEPRRNPQTDKIQRRGTVSRAKEDKFIKLSAHYLLLLITASNEEITLKRRAGLDQFRKTGNGGLGTYQTRKNALYASARRSAKDLVLSSVNMLGDMRAKLDELKSQQTTFQKNCDDFKAPSLAFQQAFAGLGKVYAPMLEELGERRSETLEDASTMLKHSGPRRQSALKEFSKNARQQLEQAKQQEKDAEDAAILIKHYKNLLRG